MSLPPSLPPEAPEVSQPVSGFGTASDLEFNSSSVDESTQNNVSNASNSNVQINNAFQRANAEHLGDGIALNSSVSVYSQVSTVNFNDTQVTAGISWSPRDKETRRIIKLRKQQIKLAVIAKEDAIVRDREQQQMNRELHCAKLASQGFSTASCKDVLVALNVETKTETSKDSHTAPEPVRGRY